MSIATTALLLIISFCLIAYFKSQKSKATASADKSKFNMYIAALIFFAVICGLYLLVSILFIMGM